MSDSITLHPTKGLNPFMMVLVCRICGEEKDHGIALVGATDKVGTCPQCGLMVYGYTRRTTCARCGEKGGPDWDRRALEEGEKIKESGVCDECRELMKQGIVFIGVRGSSDQPDGTQMVRTGKSLVLTEEAVKRILSEHALRAALQARACLIPEDVWESLGLDAFMPTEEDKSDE